MADPKQRLPKGEPPKSELFIEKNRSARRDTNTLSTIMPKSRNMNSKDSNMRFRPPVKSANSIPSTEMDPEQPLDSVFSSPMRPKSTPFPLPPSETTGSGSSDESWWLTGRQTTKGVSVSSVSSTSEGHEDQKSKSSRLSGLPTEIQEEILDYVFGFSAGPTSDRQMPSVGNSNWKSGLRYGRRKDLTVLATINHRWKCLVQSRLFRHIKLRGSIAELNDAIKFLSIRDDLREYVQHLELWFPVFRHKNAIPAPDANARGMSHYMSTNYLLPSDKCSLEDVFRFIALTLPSVRCLTLEGGERRKAPKIDVFNKRLGIKELTPLDKVETLIMKGQWNLARDNGDFANIITAIPNLQRLYSSYSRGKSKSYITMGNYLPLLPQQAKNITDLRLCLEMDGRKEPLMPNYARKAAARVHICDSLAQVASTIEHFSYSGRLCHSLFDRLAKLSDSRNTRLRTIDVTVKNCCRTVESWATDGTGSGLDDTGFMKAFEKLVLGAIKSLATLSQIRYLRVRFVDLESHVPVMNPSFLYHNGQCSGVWSARMVNEMGRVRPDATWAELKHTFGEAQYECREDGKLIVHQMGPNNDVVSHPLGAYNIFTSQSFGVYPGHTHLLGHGMGV